VFYAVIALPFLPELVALLALSVAIAYLCYRIRLVPIVGFLVAGVAIGPSALGLVGDVELIEAMAEVGVILLLFTIGVEFSLEKVSRIRSLIFGGGTLQVVSTTTVVAVALALFGVSWPAAVFTGCLVALSSTAIVLQLLSDRDESTTAHGQVSVAILIFQDLAIIAMVLVISASGVEGSSLTDIAISLIGAVAVIVVTLVAARRIVPFVLERIALTSRRELFLLTIVTICFGTAWLTSLAGVSLALGAFLAGLLVSESRYSEYALSEVLPLRTIFNAVFFVSVGMLLDLGFLLQNMPLVLAVAAGVLIAKALLTGASIAVMGYPARIAVVVGLSTAQIGEFSFVLQGVGEDVGLTPAGLGEAGTQAFIAVTVLLMALTPLVFQVAPRLGEFLAGRLANRRSATPFEDEPEGSVTSEEIPADHVVVIGYGPSGQRLAKVLAEAGLPLYVVELNPQLAAEAERRSVHVVCGDALREDILRAAGLIGAKICVIVASDELATLRITSTVRRINPTIHVVARTRYLDSVERLHDAGADTVVPEELETSVRIFANVLAAYRIPREEIDRHLTAMRGNDYRLFRDDLQGAHLMVLQGLDEAGLHTRMVAIRAGAAAAGKTLANLDLRARYGVTVLAIRRDGRTTGNFGPGDKIDVGDRLVLLASAEQFAACAPLFRSDESGQADI
jgi:CPA2 family monovalent cation:H+ antiporter-2